MQYKPNNVNTSSEVQIILKSSSKCSLSLYTAFLKSVFEKLNLNTFTVFCLPTKKTRITLLKSSHVNKTAKEQFELKQYKVLITFNNPIVLSGFMKYLLLNKPKSINVKLRARKIV
jgi:ribosomal protein S10|tara:strand:- start:2211 stop:2558 length:348 start_codon:yes stop_codon:yes gene_type:complete